MAMDGGDRYHVGVAALATRGFIRLSLGRLTGAQVPRRATCRSPHCGYGDEYEAMYIHTYNPTNRANMKPEQTVGIEMTVTARPTVFGLVQIPNLHYCVQTAMPRTVGVSTSHTGAKLIMLPSTLRLSQQFDSRSSRIKINPISRHSRKLTI